MASSQIMGFPIDSRSRFFYNTPALSRECVACKWLHVMKKLVGERDLFLKKVWDSFPPRSLTNTRESAIQFIKLVTH